MIILIPELLATNKIRTRNSRLLHVLFVSLLSLAMMGTAYADKNHSKKSGKKNFQFAVIGDSGYSDTQVRNVEKMFKTQLDREKFAFITHVGDFKGALAQCDQTNRDRVKEMFQSSKNPVVYTPGDNEWNDCATWLHDTLSGGTTPALEALEAVRDTFYWSEGDRSMGKNPIKLSRQSDDGSIYVENQLWRIGEIVFGSIHVPGKDNCIQIAFNGTNETIEDGVVVGEGLDSRGRVTWDSITSCSEEKVSREAANLAWLDKIFSEADHNMAKGVVIFLHADIYEDGEPVEYYGAYLAALKAAAVARPNVEILNFYGDSHSRQTTQPFLTDGNLPEGGLSSFKFVLDNYTAVETYGFPDTGWLRVTVDSKHANPFSLQKGGVLNDPTPPSP